jgi:hypothetical protein
MWFLCYYWDKINGVQIMIAKLLLAWGAIILCSVMLAESQYDPLGDFVVPTDPRRTTSLDDGVYLDPAADPLSIDPLMRPLDPEHTWEYLDIVRDRGYADQYASLSGKEASGNWRLELKDSSLRHIDLSLLQNREVVYGRGFATVGGVARTATASGEIYQDVLYLDVISVEDLMLYKCALTMVQDYLSGSYYAFDEQGRAWYGTATGRRS